MDRDAEGQWVPDEGDAVNAVVKNWKHSVALRLFAITFLVVMLILGGLLLVLAGSFSSFYERRQIKDIAAQMNVVRDRFVLEGAALSGAGFPPYFFEFEDDYYATIALVTFEEGGMLIRRGRPAEEEAEAMEPGVSIWPSLPGYGPGEEDRQFMLGLQEWRQDEQAFAKVVLQGETLVYRAKGIGENRAGADQLIVVAPVAAEGQTVNVLFAVSSLRPVIGAASVIRDFSGYAFGVAIVLVPLLAFLYARVLTKPLRSLNELAGRLASLDFSHRFRWRRKDEIGELARTFDFLADNLERALSELHEANAKLRKDIEREKRLERMRRDFVAGVSHELKTPLSLIGGYAEGLRDNIGDGAKRERYADVILEETRRMSAIVGDMLDLSHLEAGQYRLKLETFDAAELLEEAAERAEALGAEHGVRVRLELTEDADGRIEVAADRFRIGQVLTNLVTNAVRHAPEGGAVTLTAFQAGGEWFFRVHNEGEPIPQEELPRIWTQFYRVDKARDRESGGTGIGLAIVKQILDLHGSRYGARNERGGVTFAFSLPAAAGARQP